MKLSLKRVSKMLLIMMFLVGSTSVVSFSVLHAAPSKDVQVETKAKVVNINQAASEELQTLKGVGPAIAERIIKYRQEHGRFEHVEDLRNVQGVGEGKLQKMKEQISI